MLHQVFIEYLQSKGIMLCGSDGHVLSVFEERAFQ